MNFLLWIVIAYFFAIGIMVFVDCVLGATAEYFNAWYLLKEIAGKLTGKEGSHTYIMYHSQLGSFALPLAIFIFFLEPAIFLAVIIAIIYGIWKMGTFILR